VLDAGPDVYAHNIETTLRLTPRVRDHRCSYVASLATLRLAKRLRPDVITKSSLMLGLGESEREVDQAMDDLREHDVDVVTFGQYLRPTLLHLPVREHLSPARFAALEARAMTKGFLYVAAGPLVRSSYKAAEFYLAGMLRQRRGRSKPRSTALARRTTGLQQQNPNPMSLELLTILDQDGKAQKGKDPNLPAAELQKLYRLMVATRALDDRGLALQRQGRIGFYLQSTGQEASHLGAAYALKDSDWLFPAYRQPGILLLRKCRSRRSSASGSATPATPARAARCRCTTASARPTSSRSARRSARS
jgi:hypothetical protein